MRPSAHQLGHPWVIYGWDILWIKHQKVISPPIDSSIDSSVSASSGTSICLSTGPTIGSIHCNPPVHSMGSPNDPRTGSSHDLINWLIYCSPSAWSIHSVIGCRCETDVPSKTTPTTQSRNSTDSDDLTNIGNPVTTPPTMSTMSTSSHG